MRENYINESDAQNVRQENEIQNMISVYENFT